MSVLDSLPDRPLTDAELTSFNRSDALDIAVDVTEAERTAPGEISGLLLATEEWVKGLVHEEGGWRVVATGTLGDADERFDAMQHCEEAVRDALDEE